MAMGVGARSWGYGADTAAGEAGRKGVSAGPQAGPRASIPARGQGRGRWRSRDFDLWNPEVTGYCHVTKQFLFLEGAI